MKPTVTKDVELVISATVDGHEVTFTGGLMHHLMELYNTVDHFYLVVDIKNGTGHYVARSEKELLSLTKWNLKTLQNVLSGIEQKVECRIFTESELYPLLNSLSNDQVFLTGLINVNNERFIRKVGDQAYRQTRYMNTKLGWSYSTNSDPNIRRHRVEQAYRSMLKRK